MEVNRDSVVKVLWKINNETRAEPVRTAVVTFSQGREKNGSYGMCHRLWWTNPIFRLQSV